MNKPTQEQLDAINRLRGPLFDKFLEWLGDNLVIANRNLYHFEGALLHQTQGEAATLDTILTTTDGADVARQGSERAGRVRTR